MIKVNCSNCGKEIYKKASQIKKSMNGRFYCNRDCQYDNMKKVKRAEIEERIGQDLGEYLYQKYVVEQRTTRWIMEDAKIHSHYLNNNLKEFGIVARDGKEQFELWWSRLGEEEQQEYTEMLSKRAVESMNNIESRDKLRKVMQTKSYKAKMSKVNSGINNGMHDPLLSKEHRIESRLLFGYKKWAKEVKERDNNVCQKCNKKGNSRTLHAHHINDYYTNDEGRMDLDNAITLCTSCHTRYHNAHKGIPSTEELFNEYMKS